MNMNKVMLIGRLGADPEVRNFQDGGKVCNIRIAVSEKWKDKNTGEDRERTEWISVALYAKGSVTFAEKYLSKGSLVYVEGKFETRKWQDQSGNDRYSTEVTVRPFGGEIKPLANWGNDSGRGGTQGGGDSQPGGQQQGGQQDGGSGEVVDSEIPF